MIHSNSTLAIIRYRNRVDMADTYLNFSTRRSSLISSQSVHPVTADYFHLVPKPRQEDADNTVEAVLFGLGVLMLAELRCHTSEELAAPKPHRLVRGRGVLQQELDCSTQKLCRRQHQQQNRPAGQSWMYTYFFK